MVTACLWGPELLATSWEGPGERLGAVAEREHREGGARCGKRQAGMRVCPCLAPLGCKQQLLGHPGALAQGSLPRPGDPCVQHQVRAAGYSQPGTGPAALDPTLALLQGAERGSQQRGVGRRGRPPGTVGTRGGSLSSGHEDAWSDGAHPGTETLMRERGPAGPRHRRASGGDGGDEAGGSLPRACLCTRPGGPPCPTTGDGGAAGRAPGFVLWAWPRAGGGKGDGSVGDEGRRAQAYWGPLGEQKGQGRGHEEPPRGGR
ncbi:hypothetical protein Nmel_013931 [Mimus melanotis]